MGIRNVEDKILAEITAAFPADNAGKRAVRSIDSLPGDWDADMMKRLLRLVPGVFVIFAGGPVKAVGGETAHLSSRWSVIAATGHASGEAARRRGDGLQIGAYEILEKMIPALHGYTIQDEGSLSLVDVQNLYTGEIDKQGLAVYAATFELLMAMPVILDEAMLDPFETFVAQYDTPPFDGEEEYLSWLAEDYTTSTPAAIDNVQLEQPPVP